MKEKETVEVSEGVDKTETKGTKEIKESVDEQQPKVDPEIQGLKQGIAKIQNNYDLLYADHKKLMAELEEKRKETMTAKEREEFEKKELEKKLTQKETELEKERLKFEKTKILSDLQFDPDFMDIVVGDSIESFNNNVKLLNDKMAKLVEKQVNERLSKGNPVPNTGNTNNQSFSMDELRNMDQNTIMRNYEKVLASYRTNTEGS